MIYSVICPSARVFVMNALGCDNQAPKNVNQTPQELIQLAAIIKEVSSTVVD